MSETQQPPSLVRWEQLPDLLTPRDMQGILQVRCTKTISKLSREGQLPRPCIRLGKIIRWRKEDVREHLDRRMRMG